MAFAKNSMAARDKLMAPKAPYHGQCMGLGFYEGVDLCREHTFTRPYHMLTSEDHNGTKISNKVCLGKGCSKTVSYISAHEKKMFVCKFCGLVLCESCRDSKRCEYIDKWEFEMKHMNKRGQLRRMELINHLRQHKKRKCDQAAATAEK